MDHIHTDIGRAASKIVGLVQHTRLTHDEATIAHRLELIEAEAGMILCCIEHLTKGENH